jgi:hypothetical protein
MIHEFVALLSRIKEISYLGFTLGVKKHNDNPTVSSHVCNLALSWEWL